MFRKMTQYISLKRCYFCHELVSVEPKWPGEKRAQEGQAAGQELGSSSAGKVKHLKKNFDISICVLAKSQATSAMQAVPECIMPQHLNMQHFIQSGSK